MKQFLTPEMILDELANNPEKYPTKDDWMTYISELGHRIWDDALLTKIMNGGDISNSDEAFKKSHTTIMGIGENIWGMERE